MPGKTGIQWTNVTWNPTSGCTKVSQGCRFCYAKTIHDMRHKAYHEGKKVAPQYAEPFETVQLMPDRLEWPLSLQKPSKIFVNSVSDLFHEDVPFDFVDKVFTVMARAARHTFQILTKRPERMKAYMRRMENIGLSPDGQAPERGMKNFSGVEYPWPLPNVWLGTSVENQEAADERIPELLQIDAAVLFLSMEPLLGPVTLRQSWRDYLEGWDTEPQHVSGCSPDSGCAPGCPEAQQVHTNKIQWVIVGGESGDLLQVVRPMNPEWVFSIREQCVAAGVPFFFKQYGDWLYFKGTNGLVGDGRAKVDGVIYGASRVEILREDGSGFISGYRVRVGTKRAGRVLEGRTWDEYPG